MKDQKNIPKDEEQIEQDIWSIIKPEKTMIFLGFFEIYLTQ